MNAPRKTPGRRAAAATALTAAGAIAAAGLWGARRMAAQAGGWRPLARTLYHRWKDRSRQAALAPLLTADAAPADAPLEVYGDSLAPGWVDWSWARHDLAATERVFAGSRAIAMFPKGYDGVYLHREPALRTAGYGALGFAITRDAALSGEIAVCLADAGGQFGHKVTVDRAHLLNDPSRPTPPGWVLARIPLSEMMEGSPLAGALSGIVFQSLPGGSAAAPAPIGIDAVSLLPDRSLPPPADRTVAVTIDDRGAADRHPISPYIYGMAFAPPDYLKDLKITVNRWGGNDKTRYNWVQGNASSAARDWRFANKPAGDAGLPPGPSSAADAFVRADRAAGAETLLTVPTIGWVAKNADNGCASENVPGSGGAPLTTADGAIAGYDPTANRLRTSVRSVARQSEALPGEVAQDAWIRHLTNAFGPSGRGGVRFFAMDNEPDLWDATHTDIHPARMGYDDLAATFWTYARAVKDADPSALVTGPVSWGWTGYQYSPLDRGNDNFHTHADRLRHGDTPFLLWFLRAIRERDRQTGRRTLDVLDVHYYPQGMNLFGPAADPADQAARLRAIRSLWDPAYPDESWIGEPVRLIPRLREWIAQGYPGTKIGITEWNFGADQDISGGLAVAEALGIFGREGVYLANYWAFPSRNGPAYQAFKLLRNPDGKGNGFGDQSCHAVSEREDRVSCFAARDSHTGALTLLLINKMRRTAATVPVTFADAAAPTAGRGGAAATAWRLSAARPGALEAVSLPPPPAGASPWTLHLPPYSATLVRLPAGRAPTVSLANEEETLR